MTLGKAYLGVEAVAVPTQKAGVPVAVEVTPGAKGLV